VGESQGSRSPDTSITCYAELRSRRESTPNRGPSLRSPFDRSPAPIAANPVTLRRRRVVVAHGQLRESSISASVVNAGAGRAVLI
jgi:hypothetical protein